MNSKTFYRKMTVRTDGNFGSISIPSELAHEWINSGKLNVKMKYNSETGVLSVEAV